MAEVGDVVQTGVKRSIWYKLYHGETAFDFIGRKRTWFIFATPAGNAMNVRTIGSMRPTITVIDPYFKKK